MKSKLKRDTDSGHLFGRLFVYYLFVFFCWPHLMLCQDHAYNIRVQTTPSIAFLNEEKQKRFNIIKMDAKTSDTQTLNEYIKK